MISAAQTFALNESTIPYEHLKIWFAVREAQSAALKTARNGSLTRSVDEAARHVFSLEHYDEYFTHRLGHGNSFFPVHFYVVLLAHA